MTYETAIRNAARIQETLKTTTKVSVVAPCQSGKTSTICELIKSGFRDFTTLWVYVCAKPDVATTKQSELRIKQALGVPQKGKLPMNVFVLTPHFLKKWAEEHDGSLHFYTKMTIIVDESHTHMTTSGYGSVIDILDSQIELNTIYVTATPTVQGLVDIETVYLETGDKYVGLRELRDGGYIEHVPQALDSATGALVSELDIEINEMKAGEIGIIRASNVGGGKKSTHSRVLQHLRAKQQYDRLLNIVEYDSSNDWFLKASVLGGSFSKTEKTIVVVKDGISLGVSIQDKRSIKFVFEPLSSASDSRTVQGLPGRLCGYTELHPSVKIYTNLSAINNYIDLYDISESRQFLTNSHIIENKELRDSNKQNVEWTVVGLYGEKQNNVSVTQNLHLHTETAKRLYISTHNKPIGSFMAVGSHLVKPQLKVDIEQVKNTKYDNGSIQFDGVKVLNALKQQLRLVGFEMPSTGTFYIVQVAHYKNTNNEDGEFIVSDNAYKFGV